jgi:plastocyanin
MIQKLPFRKLIFIIALAIITMAAVLPQFNLPLTAETSTGVLGDTHFVTVQDFTFTPDDLTIAVGDTVQWDNVDGFHNVVADGGTFTSGPPASDPWTFSHTFNSAGTFAYYCEVHGGPGGAGMSGSIIVGGTPTPTSTATATATPTSTPQTPTPTNTPTAVPSDEFFLYLPIVIR